MSKPRHTEPDRLELDAAQRWLQSVIVHPDGVEAGIHAAAARREYDLTADCVEELINPSKAQTSIERLYVYSNAYKSRLLDVLIGEFPALVHAVGEEVFIDLANGYLEAHSPHSYTLAELSREFPEYLARTRPPRETVPHAETDEPFSPNAIGVGAAGSLAVEESTERERPTHDGMALTDDAPDWADFLIDLARLERIYSEVFDGPGIEGQRLLQPDDVSRLTPDQWLTAKLTTAPCLRLATFHFPVHEYTSAVRHQQAPTPPTVETTYLAITRRDYIVRRVAVDESEFATLSALIKGETIESALQHLAANHPGSLDDLATHLHRWFQSWTAAGYFVGMAFDS